jgi:hypothetical protein
VDPALEDATVLGLVFLIEEILKGSFKGLTRGVAEL